MRLLGFCFSVVGARRTLAGIPLRPVSFLAFATDRLGFASKRTPLHAWEMLCHDAEIEILVQQVSTK